MSISYWPHQDRIHKACVEYAVSRKGKIAKWCVVAPCGAGKTLMMLRIILGALAKGKRICLYSCRIQNTKQLMDMLEEAGVDYGAVAASFRRYQNLGAMVQVCQLQTVASKSGAVPDCAEQFP